jgi:hypothetical protein
MNDLVKRLRIGAILLDQAAEAIEHLEAELDYAIGILVAQENELDPQQLNYLMSAKDNYTRQNQFDK